MMYFITNNQSLFNTFENIQTCSIEFCLNYFKDKEIIGLDTETEGFDPYTKELLLVQLGDYNNQFAIDNTINLNLFKSLFEDKNKTFILHNAKFDLRFFYHKRIIISNVFDTYLAERLLWLGYPPGIRSLSLKACTYNYLGIELDKNVRGIIHKEMYSERVIEYGCNDVKYLYQIREQQLKLLKERESLNAIAIENEFVKVLAYIEYCGIKLDIDKWKQKMLDDRKRYEASRDILNNWVIENFPNSKYINNCIQGDLFEGFTGPECTINWASSKQVIPFFESLGFNLLAKDKKTGAMTKSVEATIIESQLNVSPISSLYLSYKQNEKVVSTYGQSFLDHINPVSGRIHTQFNQLMDTTRLSCGGTDKETGQENINLQNIPADSVTRSCFVPNNGNVLIDCDYTA